MDTYVTTLPTARPIARLAESVLRVEQFTRLLRRHLWLIGACAVLGFGLAVAYAETLPKSYTARSILSVEGDRFAIPELQGALRADSAPDPMPFVRTEAQALTAPDLLAAVAKQLHLDTKPEFNPRLRPPSLMQSAKDALSGMRARFFPRHSDETPAGGTDEAILGAVTKALAVFQDDRSLVISVAFTSHDPQQSALFVNSLMAQYVADRSQRRSDANAGANAVLEQRISQVRADLTDIQQKMNDLRSRNDMVALRAGSVGQQQVEELTTAAAHATLARSQLEVTYERAQSAMKQGTSDALAAVLNSSTISRLRDQEAQASQRLADLSSHYGSGYPGIRSAAAQLASIRQQITDEAARIVASLDAQLRVARAQEADVKQQLDTARSAGVQSENVRAQLDQLQQEAATQQHLYQTLLEREQQTVGQPVGSSLPDVRVLSKAEAPSNPSGPNMKIAGAMGGAGGALLGCLLALTRMASVRGVETADDVTAATGMAVLATIPRKLIRRHTGALAMGLPITTTGADAQAVRVVRDRLRFTGRSGVPRCVVFLSSSVAAAAMAARISAACARVAAADGEHVLLIDGDLQSPSLDVELGLLASRRRRTQGMLTGVPAVLAGADWRDMVFPDELAGLDLLLGADAPKGVSAGLGGGHFQNLLVEARTEYDLVILHAPPAGSAAGAALAQRADTAVFVIEARSDQSEIQAATAQLSARTRTPLAALFLSWA